MRVRNQTYCRQSATWIALFLILSVIVARPTAAQFAVSGSSAAAAAAEPELWLELEGFVEFPGTPVRPHNDLLQHLRENFEIDPVLNKRVRAELNWFVRHPEYVERVLRRSQRYLPYISAGSPDVGGRSSVLER